MQNRIRTWEEKVINLMREVENAKQYRRDVQDGKFRFKTAMESGEAVWDSFSKVAQFEKIAGYEGLQLRKEIMEVLDEKSSNLKDEELLRICEVYNDSLFVLPEYEAYSPTTRILEITEDYKEHKENYEKFQLLWEEKWYELREAKKASQKIESPVMASVIETEEKEEEKVEEKQEEEDTSEVVEEPKQKPKKLSKTAKLKIQRERRRIKREEAKEKEIRKLEREIKKIKAEEERLRKLRERKEKKLAQLLKKGKSDDSDNSNGSEGTGEKGGREEEGGEKREIQKADIAENLKEEWRELKRELTKEAYFLLNKCGFTNKISRIDWKVKGVVGKPEGVVKKAEEYIRRIKRFEGKIQDSQKFAEWAPAWLSRKHRKIWKLKKAAEEWLKDTRN